MVPPLITLEEHYVSPHLLAHLGDKSPYSAFPPQTFQRLQDLGQDRIANLDNGGISLQVLSHGPLNAPPDICRSANDGLADAIKANPKRLAAFAMLPMQYPTEAAVEFERTIKDLGFVGALSNNHVDGQFYDDERFWPVFAKAVELDVPVYIHPTFASELMRKHHAGDMSGPAGNLLPNAAWGWHVDTGLHVIRLWAAGLFDMYPSLKIIIGHMGELLPFQLDRVTPIANGWGKGRKRDLRQVFRENFWITTSGMFSQAPLACLLRTTTIDRILYSVDYPFSPNEKGLAFIKELESSDLLTPEQLQDICYRNAEKLLRLKI